MRFLNQVVAVTRLNILNLPRRIATSTVAIVGVLAVVLVFAAVLSMARGFELTMLATGSDDMAVVLRSGATAELTSGLSNEQTLIIGNAPGVLRDGDDPVTSAELFVVVDVRKRSNNLDANVPFRGIQNNAFKVRSNARLVTGRMFETGRNEIIVGRGVQQEFVGLDVGATIRFGRVDWQVVGMFEDGGSVSESELWTDVRVLQDAYRRGTSYQSVRARLESPESIEQLREALANDPRLDVDVFSEQDYYAAQAEPLSNFIRLLGYPVTFLMAVGAVFGALNSMYASVSARGKEIATLRALGFGPFAVLVSTIIESTLLALVGGIAGGALAFIVFNGFRVSTLSSFSQVVFDFAVTPELLAQGIVVALVIGFVGGFLPALRAARLPVAQALREL